MEQNLIAIFHEASAGSITETVNFPTVVSKLIAAGAEGYHCDLYRREKTYYMPDGSSHVEAEPALDPREFNGAHIARDFAEDKIVAALRGVQAGSITYVEFLRRIMTAGCVGYQVCIAGKRALYFGRAGQVYVEKFPGTN
jgi:uncharacterized protein YbcV (DUF1398 family)